MLKYVRLLGLLERKTIGKAAFLLLLCLVIGMLDVLTILVSADLDLLDFESQNFKLMAVLFSAATFFRLVFLVFNADVCATISSEASILFLRNSLGKARLPEMTAGGGSASDIMAKTASLTNFVVNPLFHFCVAFVSLTGVLISLMYSFPDLIVILIVIMVAAATLVFLMSRVTRWVGSTLRERQDSAAAVTLEMLSSAHVIGNHPNIERELERFWRFDHKYKITLSRLAVMGQAPRTAIDLVMAGALLGLVLVSPVGLDALADAVPALFVSLVRVIPYINSLGQALMTLRGYAPSVLDALLDATHRPSSGNFRKLDDGIMMADRYEDTGIFVKNLKLINENSLVNFQLSVGAKLYFCSDIEHESEILLRCLTAELEPSNNSVGVFKMPHNLMVQAVLPDLPIFSSTLRHNLFLDESASVSTSSGGLCGLDIELDEHVVLSQLSRSERVIINILRAVYAQSELILIDDVMGQLSSDSRDAIFSLLRNCDAGVLLCGPEEQAPPGFKKIFIHR